MTQLKLADPQAAYDSATESLGVLAHALENSKTTPMTEDQEVEVIGHLDKILVALHMLKSTLIMCSYINRPAFEEGVRAYNADMLDHAQAQKVH